MSIARVNSPRKWTQPCLPDENVPTDSIYWSMLTETQGKFEGKWSWCAPQLHKMLLCRINAVLHGAVLPASAVKMLLERLTNFRGSRNVGKCLRLKDIHSKDDNNNAYMDRFSSKLSLHYFIIYYYFHYILLLSLYTIFSLPFLLVETQTPKSNSCL